MPVCHGISVVLHLCRTEMRTVCLLTAASRPHYAVAVRTTRLILSAPLNVLPQTARGIAISTDHRRSTASSHSVPNRMIAVESGSGDNLDCPFGSARRRVLFGAENFGLNAAAHGCIF